MPKRLRHKKILGRFEHLSFDFSTLKEQFYRREICRLA